MRADRGPSMGKLFSNRFVRWIRLEAAFFVCFVCFPSSCIAGCNVPLAFTE